MVTKEIELLNKIGNSQKLSKRIVSRSEMLSYYLSCGSKRKTSRDLGVSRSWIYNWVERWENRKKDRLEYWSLYNQGEIKGESYKRFIIRLLEDKKRSGTPSTFTELEKIQIVALSIENPMDLGLPFTHWTSDLLAKEVIQRGIVSSISSRHISRILKKSKVSTSQE